MIVTILEPLHTLDFPVSKVSVELLVPSASLVPLTPRALDLKPLSASSTLAVDLVAALSLPSVSAASLLSAARRVMSVFLVMLVSLTVPIPLNTAVPSESSPALVVAWVEVLATMVSVLARVASRVKTVPPLFNQVGNEKLS